MAKAFGPERSKATGQWLLYGAILSCAVAGGFATRADLRLGALAAGATLALVLGLRWAVGLGQARRVRLRA